MDAVKLIMVQDGQIITAHSQLTSDRYQNQCWVHHTSNAARSASTMPDRCGVTSDGSVVAHRWLSLSIRSDQPARWQWLSGAAVVAIRWLSLSMADRRVVTRGAAVALKGITRVSTLALQAVTSDGTVMAHRLPSDGSMS